jgi:polyphosphate kinase
VFDKSIQKELMQMLQIQLSDNVKARMIEKNQVNPYKKDNGPEIRSQLEIYTYFETKLRSN